MSETAPRRETVELSIEAPARRQVLDFINVVPFRSGDATPKVSNNRIFKAVGAATITNFLGGQAGQDIWVHGNGSTQVAHNANIIRRGAATAVLAANLMYVFVLIDGVWCETA